MSTLSKRDAIPLEKFLEMGGGYVCDFSDRTFGDFVLESVDIDVYTPEYTERGTSKAKRLRTFWSQETNYKTARLLREMIDYWKQRKAIDKVGGPFNKELYEMCLGIVAKLEKEGPVEDLDVFAEKADDTNFEHLADAIQKSIQDGKPEVALDRLHTYVVKYVRGRCEAHGVAFTKETPLHSLFGGYLKALKQKGAVESEMTERILKSGISTLEAFNQVRNEKSLAHDNSLLNGGESMLIFRHVASVIRFVESVEKDLN